jgi:hypothetical protein
MVATLASRRRASIKTILVVLALVWVTPGQFVIEPATHLNFTLKAGSKAVDAGMKIPNVNDGFAGRATDLERL